MSLWLDGERRLRLGWRLALFLAGLVALLLALAVVLGVVAAAYVLAGGHDQGVLDSSALQAWMQIAALWPSALASIAFVWLCRRLLDRRSLGSLGLVRPDRHTPAGLLLGLSVSAGPAALLLALGGYELTGASASLQTAVLLPTLALAAFQEELICRGYVLRNLVESGRPGAGVVVSSVVFWLLHSLNPAVWSSPIPSLNLLLAGVLLALAARVSGDLWFPTALHYAWNLGQGVLFQLPISGLQMDGWLDLEPTGGLPLWLTGGDFGLESSLLTSGVEGAVASGLGFLLWRRGRAPAPAPLPRAPITEDAR